MTDAVKDVAFYLENPSEFEQLSESERNLILDSENGDTALAETQQDPVVEQKEENEEEPVVLAKDGKHIIPYEQYAELREATKQSDAKISELQALLDQQAETYKAQAELINELKQAKDQDTGTGTTDAQDEVFERFANDYPGFAEDLKPVIQQMIAARSESEINRIKQEFEETIKPLAEKAALAEELVLEREQQKLFNELAKVHPDYNDHLAPLLDWINEKPTFIRDQYLQIYNTCTAQQAAELLSEYKAATGFKEKVEDLTEKAEKIIASTKPKGPASLSEVPGSVAGPNNELEAIAEMSPAQLERLFMGKSPEEIEKLLNKLV